MAYFKAKKHLNSISARALPQTLLESLQRYADPLTGFHGPTSKGKGRGYEREGEDRKKGGKGMECKEEKED